jgi:4-diphosphocytidyl-2-C-methyl-D-erythritol kinase
MGYFSNKNMISFSNAKINLGLLVKSKREDGYHNIETVFYPVPLTDIIEVTPLPGGETCMLENSGLKIDGEPAGNLCVRAWNEINRIRPLPGTSIHLHKVIPAGAGFGGGSSNAAFVLMALNTLFDLQLTTTELENLAGRIGSDCPFFIHNKPLFATGRGDIFGPAGIDLSGTRIAIVFPGINISSRWAYENIKIKRQSDSLKDILMTDPSSWQNRLLNDFEPAVFDAYPVIRDIKDKLMSLGAFYASMTGSGSAVYGLFNERVDSRQIKKKFQGMFSWDGCL